MDTLFATAAEIARAHGWNDLGQRIDDCQRRPVRDELLIATARGIEPAALIAWLREGGAREPRVTALEALSGDPLAALEHRHVVALFDCGRLFERADIDALMETALTRPPRSVTIVLGGADRLQTPEEFAKIERNAWRLLVPGPKPEWSGQNLTEYDVLVWSAGQTAPFLTERVARDTGWLRERITRPLSDDEQADLRWLTGAWLSDQVDLRLEAAEAASQAKGSATDAVRYRRAAEEINGVCRQLDNRWQFGQESMLRSSKANLQAVEGRLSGGLRRLLIEVELPRESADGGKGQIEQVFRRYFEQQRDPWLAELERDFERFRRVARQDMNELLGRLDWKPVNDAVKRGGRPESYPEALYALFSAEAAPMMRFDERRAGRRSSPTLTSPTSPEVLAKGAAVGGGIGIATVALIGLNPFLALGAAIVSGAAFAMNEREKRARRNIDAAEAYGRDAIKRWHDDAEDHVERAVRDWTQATHQPVLRRLRECEEWLRHEASAAAPIAAAAGNDLAADRARLSHARTRPATRS